MYLDPSGDSRFYILGEGDGARNTKKVFEMELENFKKLDKQVLHMLSCQLWLQKARKVSKIGSPSKQRHWIFSRNIGL